LVLRGNGWIELSNAEEAEDFGGVFVSAGDTGFAALLSELDLDGADRLQGLPCEGSGELAVGGAQRLLQGAISNRASAATKTWACTRSSVW
jgi:hypothetical protein